MKHTYRYSYHGIALGCTELIAPLSMYTLRPLSPLLRFDRYVEELQQKPLLVLCCSIPCLAWFRRVTRHDRLSKTILQGTLQGGRRRGLQERLLVTVERRKLAWFGHVTRHDSLSQTTPQGTLEGGRRRGRQRKCSMDNNKEWTYLPVPELLTRASSPVTKQGLSVVLLSPFRVTALAVCCSTLLPYRLWVICRSNPHPYLALCWPQWLHAAVILTLTWLYVDPSGSVLQ